MTHSMWTLPALLLCVAAIVWFIDIRFLRHKSYKPTTKQDSIRKDETTSTLDAYSNITPLADFEWRDTEPIKLRPFKPKYHLTMALENITLSDLIEMDRTYVERIQLRRRILRDHERDTVAANPIIKPAVNELYTWMMGTYLPRRFSRIYKLTRAAGSLYPVLFNTATNETLSITPPANPVEGLKILGGNIDSEFLLLLPTAEEGKYRLEGFVTCFPSGFNTRLKLGLNLAGIHGPVPGYGAKLEKSMDRFFAALPVGKIVKRANWSITTNRDLFALSGNHGYESEADGVSEREDEEVDVEQCVVRCERQTLHRLPESKALVFAFKTYQYPLSQIKEEGSAEDLCAAIDGLAKGSVPKMSFYKRQVVWGEPVKAYLRG